MYFVVKTATEIKKSGTKEETSGKYKTFVMWFITYHGKCSHLNYIQWDFTQNIFFHYSLEVRVWLTHRNIDHCFSWSVQKACPVSAHMQELLSWALLNIWPHPNGSRAVGFIKSTLASRTSNSIIHHYYYFIKIVREMQIFLNWPLWVTKGNLIFWGICCFLNINTENILFLKVLLSVVVV